MKLKLYILLIIGLFSQTSVISKPNDYLNNLIKNDKFNEALSYLEKSDLSPLEYYRYKGVIYHGLYNPDSTVFYLDLAYRNNAQDDEVLIKFSQALLWKKNFKDASPILNQVKDKTSIDYQKVVANRYELLGEFDKSLELYNQVIQREELPYGSMEKKAILLSWMKKFNESIDLFDQIINTKIVSEPLRIRSLIKKAEVISWKKEFDQALNILDDVIKRDGKNSRARFVKAQIFEWQGKFKEAKNIYKDILLIEQDNVEAKWRLEKLMWVK
jgi:tetratricopeptide (TPR) repeat protein